MKTTKNILFLLIVISFSSCQLFQMARGEYREYQIANDSKYSLEINAYLKRKNIGTISLKSGQKFSVFNDIRHNDFGFYKETPDSIVIAFDNKKNIIQYCSGKYLFSCQDIAKNLTNTSFATSYEEIKKNQNGKYIVEKYTYGFDDSDYLKAK